MTNHWELSGVAIGTDYGEYLFSRGTKCIYIKDINRNGIVDAGDSIYYSSYYCGYEPSKPLDPGALSAMGITLKEANSKIRSFNAELSKMTSLVNSFQTVRNKPVDLEELRHAGVSCIHGSEGGYDLSKAREILAVGASLVVRIVDLNGDGKTDMVSANIQGVVVKVRALTHMDCATLDNDTPMMLGLLRIFDGFWSWPED